MVCNVKKAESVAVCWSNEKSVDREKGETNKKKSFNIHIFLAPASLAR